MTLFPFRIKSCSERRQNNSDRVASPECVTTALNTDIMSYAKAQLEVLSNNLSMQSD